MKCDVCKETEATVHLTQIISGTMHKIDLCEACAKAKGVSDPSGFSLADLLLGLGHGDSTLAQTQGQGEPQCHGCGMTQSDFKKSGRLGCSECYQTFADSLYVLLRSMHKADQHIGKRPSGHSELSPHTDSIDRLRKELDQAIKAENFEVAPQLRDQIKKMEQESRVQKI